MPTKTQPPTPERDDSSPADDARRQRANRITAAVVIAMIVLWAVAIAFRDPLRARYGSWRTAREQAAARTAALARTRDADPEVRLAGERTLIDLLRRQRDAAIAAALEKPTPETEVRLDIAGWDEIRARFRELLADPDPSVRIEAINGLLVLRDAAAVPPLVELALNPDHPCLAAHATAAISELVPADRLADTMVRIARESADPNVRAQALDSLWSCPQPPPLAPLVDLLEDTRQVTALPQSPVLVELQRALGAALKSPTSPLQLPAQLGPEILAPLIGQPASQPDAATVADYANRLLRKFTGQDFGFRSTDPAADRQAAIRKWRQYLAAQKA